VPPLLHRELAREPQVQHVDAGKPLDPGRLEDNCLRALGEPPKRAEKFHRLDWQARVVLEVHTRAYLPGEFIAAVYLKDISGFGMLVTRKLNASGRDGVGLKLNKVIG